MKKDLVIGIVGTLILLTAMVGVFRYEAAQRGASFDVTWEPRAIEAAAIDGGTNEGESTVQSVNVTQANLTAIEFILEWTDNQANTGPDEFTLTVMSPTGETRSASGDAGRVSVVFEGIAPTPPEMRLLASDESAARAQALRQYSSTAGMGAWNVTVTLVQAGDATTPAGPAPVPVPQLQDGANDWTLRPILTAFEAAFTPA